MDGVEVISEHACFGGVQRFCRYASNAIGLPMRFSLYLPPQAGKSFAGTVPLLVYLAGLTCNEETFPTKAGAQRVAAELGLALLAPDTSPRGAGVAGEADDWEIGVGAGFYLDAVEAPWAKHYRMESHIVELVRRVASESAIDADRIGIFGHSMGGHGALTLALRHPDLFRSVSALAPICAPSECPWGQKAFTAYLGADEQERWLEHDASALMRARTQPLSASAILIDQGLDDKFLATQLHPHRFEEACASAQQPLTLRRHEGYDHGYYFVSTFVADHLAHHAEILV